MCQICKTLTSDRSKVYAIWFEHGEKIFERLKNPARHRKTSLKSVSTKGVRPLTITLKYSLETLFLLGSIKKRLMYVYLISGKI